MNKDSITIEGNTIMKDFAKNILILLSFLCIALNATDLKQILEPIRKEYELPSLAAVVIDKNRIKTYDATGYRKYEGTKEVTNDDLYHLGSCSKAFTATLASMLIEKGKLNWDTKLIDIFPDLNIHPDYRSITVEQIMGHWAGLPGKKHTYPPNVNSRDIREIKGDIRKRRLEYLKMILTNPPEVEPGSSFLYSNAGYILLGAIIEQVMNEPYEDLLKKMLFIPLKMNSAGFGPMGKIGKTDQPLQHKVVNGEIKPYEPTIGSDNPQIMNPSGRIHCSMDDWAKFIVFHLNYGKAGYKRLLRKSTIQKLHSPMFKGSYGAGFRLNTRNWGGGQVLSHSGSNGKNYCVVWVAPKKRFAVLIATNIAGDKEKEACDIVAGKLIDRFLLKKK